MIFTVTKPAFIHEIVGYFSTWSVNWNLPGFKMIFIFEWLSRYFPHTMFGHRDDIFSFFYKLVVLGLFRIILEVGGIYGLLAIIGTIMVIAYVAVIYQKRIKERIPAGPDDPPTA